MFKKLVPLAVLPFIFLSACNQSSNDVLAVVNGQPITSSEVDTAAKTRLLKIESQIFDIKKDTLEDLIDDKLVEADAKAKGKSVEDTLKDIESQVQPTTEAEAKRLYEMQKNRFEGKKFEDVKDTIVRYLDGQKSKMALNSYVRQLRKNAQIQINMSRPRIEVSVDDDPSKGPKNAPITLIEFSEFQCPYCKRARPTIDRILKEYDGKVHYVFRDFPLGFHQNAKGAANAANCAGDQGKYWEFNEELWNIQRQLSDSNYIKIAEKLQLNMDDFKKCSSSGKYFDEIDKDQNDGLNVGVTGTPAYFINGVFLSGARPFSAFKEVIDAELNK